VLAAYLAIDLAINSRNYVVTGGHYGFGSHIFTNMLEYIVAMCVGRHDVTNYVLIASGIVVLFLRGSRLVVFATAWMVLALLPFVPFTWSNTSRYMYLPAMGFSMLVAEGVIQVDRLAARRLPRTSRSAIWILVAAAVAVRFALFAVSNVGRFVDQTEDYRREIRSFRQVHATLGPYSRVEPGPLSPSRHKYQFLNALVQWEYGDPTIQLISTAPD
jgi:hypothetical protein